MTDDITPLVERHGAAVHDAARSLVTAGADRFAVDVLEDAARHMRAGAESAEAVRRSFAELSANIRPQPPRERLDRATALLEQPARPAPAFLRHALGAESAEVADEAPAPEAAPVADGGSGSWVALPAAPLAASEPLPAAASWEPAGAAVQASAPPASAPPAPAPPRRWKLPLLIVLVAALAVAGAALLGSRNPQDTAATPIPRATATVASSAENQGDADLVAAERAAQRRAKKQARTFIGRQIKRHRAQAVAARRSARLKAAATRSTAPATGFPSATTVTVPAVPAPTVAAPVQPQPAATTAPAPITAPSAPSGNGSPPGRTP